MASAWKYRAGEDIEPGSWEECVQLLLASGGDDVLYRGHRKFDWKLESSLERALQEHALEFEPEKYERLQSMAADAETERWTNTVEIGLMQAFRRQAARFGIPDLPGARDLLGWWEVMQHHGAPTRLMDWTRSPFVAIWFALDGHTDGEGDMALWVYDREVASRALQPTLARLRSTQGYERLDAREFQNKLVEYALEDRVPVLMPVTPRQFGRSVAQESVLTVSPRIDVGRPADWYLRQKLATRLRLREEWKLAMQTACSSLGLSRVGLFRDLDSLGAAISAAFRDNEPLPEAH